MGKYTIFYMFENPKRGMQASHSTGTRKETRTITAAVNRTSIITLRLSDCKSQASLTLFIRHHELTNENVSYFENEEIIFIDLKVTRKPNQLNIADDLILMRFLRIAFMK